MFREIEWLFFDVGSTLTNEEKVYEQLIRQLSEQVEHSYEDVAEMITEAYQNNQNGYQETIKKLGATKPKWDPSLELLYADAPTVLEVLHRKYKIGIIANQVLGCRERLEKMGIAKFLDVVVASAEEGVSKPDPRIFRIALARSNCKPHNAIMIGDRIDNDIVPAKKLGMRTIWIKQGFGQYWHIIGGEEVPDATVDSLSELLDILI